MALVYVDEELHEKLKELARRENRPIVGVIRRLVTVTTESNGTTEVVETPMDAAARWSWMKRGLGIKCGCIFDDDMEVSDVINWEVFKVVNQGKLMERYLIKYPERRPK